MKSALRFLVYEHTIVSASLLAANASSSVSVILTTKDRPKDLCNALDSLCWQKFKDFDVVVVNDAGVDVLPLLQNYSLRLNIQYIKQQESLGVSAARNLGIKYALGTYITYLDDDDFYYENHLLALIQAISSRKQSVVCSHSILATQHKVNDNYTAVKREVFPDHIDDYANQIFEKNITPLLNIMHNKNCLNTVGLFKEGLHYYEDWDFCLRLSRFYEIDDVLEFSSEVNMRESSCSIAGPKDKMLAAWCYVKSLASIYQEQNRAFEFLNNATQAKVLHKSPRLAYDYSIIVHCTKALPDLIPCLEAIIENTQASFELILLLDSTLIQERDVIGILGGDLSVIQFPYKVGRLIAHNEGAIAAKGKMLVFLAQDTLPQQLWLDEMYKVSKAHQHKCIVSPCLESTTKNQSENAAKSLANNLGTSHISWLGGKLETNGSVTPNIELDLLQKEFNPSAPHSSSYGKLIDCAHAACMMLPRSEFARLGGFAQRYIPGFYEDADLCLRAKEAGLKTVACIDSRVIWKAIEAKDDFHPAAFVSAQLFAAQWAKVLDISLQEECWAIPTKHCDVIDCSLNPPRHLLA